MQNRGKGRKKRNTGPTVIANERTYSKRSKSKLSRR